MNGFWARLTEFSPPLVPAVIGGLGVLAAALVLWRPSWRVLRQVVTLAHEGAHAGVALLCGRSLHGVRLHRDTSGLTMTRGLPSGAGVLATLAAGYLGPGLLGVLGAAVLRQGRPALLLWALLVVLALLLLQIRNWFGFVVVLVSGAVLVGVTHYLPGEWQSAFAHLLVWFWLLAAPRAVIELQQSRRGRRTTDSDADQLGRLTVLPAGAWVGLFLLGTLGCLVIGALLLLGGSR